jgi:hypothetical protein
MSYPTGDAFTPKILNLKYLHKKNKTKKNWHILGATTHI